MPLSGGIMQYGYQCGMIWGAALAAGAEAYRLFGVDSQAETRSILAAKRLVDAFRACSGEINCLEITDIDKSSSIMKMIFVFLIKGKTIGCMRMSAKYAQAAFNEINIESPIPPVGCTTMLARKIGLSEMHTVMVAGLAGGIGLCGGACGALGAAIWILGMNSIIRKSANKIDYKDPKALDIIDRFLKCTDYKFECSDIVGRKFKNISEHARYLSDGGCTEIIKMLADTLSAE
ncbi:MAG: C-GCAxxG-C-C family protein [Desulfobacterales bacterium]|nr:C-GCAxxG-C-C family protein [Desulfobacterales bacterium]